MEEGCVGETTDHRLFTTEFCSSCLILSECLVRSHFVIILFCFLNVVYRVHSLKGCVYGEIALVITAFIQTNVARANFKCFIFIYTSRSLISYRKVLPRNSGCIILLNENEYVEYLSQPARE